MRKFIIFMRAFWFMRLVRGWIDVSDWDCWLRKDMIWVVYYKKINWRLFMRLRNIPGAKDAILECDWVIDEPERFKGKWESVFGEKRPLFLEVGMGKGRFLKRPDGYGGFASGYQLH